MFRNPLVTLGPGVAIEIRGDDLSVALVKSRLKGVSVLGQATLADFRRRPPAEWGEEYRAFLKNHRYPDLPATLILPRAEAIVRLLTLPAAAKSKLKSAVGYQLDSLHPFGEEEVYSGYAALEARDGSQPVAVVIAARSVVDGYADLFAEAGIKLGGVTVAAAAYYGAIRLLRGRPASSFLLVDEHNSTFELYGESPARPFFSAAFDSRAMPLEKAVAAAAGDLRLPEEQGLPPVEEVLGAPLDAPAGFELRPNVTVFAGAIAAACPRWGWRTNLLPAARRSSSSRWPIAATVATAVCAVAVALVLWLRGPIQDRRYARELDREARRLEAVEKEIRALEQQAQRLRARRAQLEAFRRRSEADLALVTEISRRLPNTVWLGNIEVAEDAVQLQGQAEAAAPLLGLLDNSGAVTGAAFSGSITRNENREVFRIRANRKAGR
jgi:Tfp pilus assembly protein PilN